MAITKEMLDELLKDYHGPEDLTGEDGLLKQLPRRWSSGRWELS